ncbi:response regulator transcription factor [Salinispirillum marinum]|uniref:Response regulator transcription factor n=2 Tax=Saccharospirillaceae TaxID=255527 RepID=A0ABV8BE66_9GAMM
MPRILVIEDHPDLRIEMVDYLKFLGFDTTGADSIASMNAALSKQCFDVVLLDLGLPDGDAMTEIAPLRAKLGLAIGIIIVSARGSADERVQGLAAGADHYLVKPVHLPELSTLIERLCERLPPESEGWVLRKSLHELQAPNGQTVSLTGGEFTLVLELAQAEEELSREHLCRRLQPGGAVTDTRKLDTYFSRLRSKIRQQSAMELPIHAFRNRGYALSEPVKIVR